MVELYEEKKKVGKIIPVLFLSVQEFWETWEAFWCGDGGIYFSVCNIVLSVMVVWI